MSKRKSTRAQEYKCTGSQEHKSIRIVIPCVLIGFALFCQAFAGGEVNSTKEDYALRIYLLREITVKDEAISLGEVSIIRGKESLVSKASGISLGRISMPGQSIVVDRPTVLSRLACNGISVSKVALTGAKKVIVRQEQQIIQASEFVELARGFLVEHLPEGTECQFEPIRSPTDLVVPWDVKDVKLSRRLSGGMTGGQAKVEIAVVGDGKEIGVCEVTFGLKHNSRRAVALVDIPAGGTIGPENIRIEKVLSDSPEACDWREPYGLVARRRIAADTVIRSNMVGLRKGDVIVKRNRAVVIQYESPVLLVTAVGKAMQDGRAGEYIKFRNVESQRIILAKVIEDGTVEPVF